jgi:hypothetical protein
MFPPSTLAPIASELDRAASYVCFGNEVMVNIDVQVIKIRLYWAYLEINSTN